MSFEQRYSPQGDQNQTLLPPTQQVSPGPRLSSSGGSVSNGYHYNMPGRRSSVSTAPYTIPIKSANSNSTPTHIQRLSSSYNGTSSSFPLNSGGMSSSPHTGGPIHSHFHQQQTQQSHLGTSVPMLSREFVVRRISEGETGRLKEELKCEACGKGYKHISSLAKHLWEHTPEWNMTKKLLISKHQQVQLLEAASILCSMTENGSENGGFRSRSQSLSTPPPSFYAQQHQMGPNNHQQQQVNSISNNSHQLPQKLEADLGGLRETEPPVSPSPEVPNDENSSTSPLSIEEQTRASTNTTINTPNSSSLQTPSQPISTSTSRVPIYTTTLRKNSVSRYPPSSLSVSVSSTPRKTMMYEKSSKPNDLLSQYEKDGLIALKAEDLGPFSGDESENDDDDNDDDGQNFGKKFVPRDNREDDQQVFGELED
ncbi:hypothetical protein OGAPHI_007062 [Ogataea philodendri]|uniref:C2H2-type domain-containing protein n=1 Tax=Ogataea philodendri TaxID=1378263 RepID=A0A9P8NWF7_9ASCO|nr:uncharacterized protein OGAPHI_007062 [Ogataea philodendri]KAH3660476.1 hypothetical protein OGAPHI_007062 [Ogataea philodendri]